MMLEKYKSNRMFYFLMAIVFCSLLVILRQHESSGTWLTMGFVILVAICLAICGFQVGRYNALVRGMKTAKATPEQHDALYEVARENGFAGTPRMFMSDDSPLSSEYADMLLSEVAQEKSRSAATKRNAK